ncbi:Ribosome biogenesis ATPase rix7 [Diatrype stigma]|uniref:Peroxisomal ATPase PEX1 n=1 Tax=Diatrype stigma TaxID=117547 RepID=A0AAN9URR4_9PEZI
MPPRTLHGLDRDVYQIVRKFEDEHERENSSKPPRFTVSGVYDWIKRSNSSLARQKKRPLEDSIERALRLRKEERLEDDEEAALEDAESAENEPKPKERDYFLMNKQLAKAWDVPRRRRTSPSTPDVATPAEGNAAETRPADDQLASQPKAKRRKVERSAAAKDDRSPPTGVSFDDLGGMDDAIRVLGESVTFPMKCPEACIGIGLEAARGVLLHGPPGCGKTMLANALAAELGVAYIPVSAPSLVAGMSGESEKKIRELYEEAKQLAPCLIFIDEIDAIMGKRENAQREMEKRIVAQMLTCMDDLGYEKTGGKAVVTLAATNRPDSIDPALRRAGRFNREISLGIPNEPAREAIFHKLLQKCKVSDDLNYKQLARSTPGFVGADLEDVVSVAKNDVARKIMDVMVSNAPTTEIEMDVDDTNSKVSETVRWHRRIAAGFSDPIPSEQYVITMELMLGAIKKVQPAAKREGFTTIPDTNWTHIGALQDVREQLMLSIVKPIQIPESFAAVGLEAPSGVLLWGPPGCGKTLLAKAVANESKANFISVKGPELLNKYVGESERSVRQVFGRARASAPCILFFDELDALVPRRDGGAVDASARVVNQLLTELDGVGSRDGVYVVGATNRPDMIDPAILRPGRLGTNIFVDLPDADGRADILRTRMRRLLPAYYASGGDDVDELLDVLDRVARDGRCEGFSGADLDNLHVAAGQAAVKRAELQLREDQEEAARRRRDGEWGHGTAIVRGPNRLTAEDWEAALSQITPSVSEEHARKFRRLKETGWE